LFKLKDSHKKDFAMGSTHEEVMAKLAKSRIASYKDLPFALFQIQSKFRNEIRYTGGLLRTREFVMKDLYSFHSTQADFERYYEKAAKAYLKIFKRCGIKALRVKASGGGFTNAFTDEFQAITPVGEDTIIFCKKCGFAQNQEISKLNKGDKCPQCGALLKKEKGIEIGNIFPLGTKYSESFDLKFKDKSGEEKFVIMASYGIGVGRLMSAIVETHNDAKGIIWPEEVAPFLIHIIPVEIDDRKVEETAKTIYQNGQEKIKRVIYDDRRSVSAGEKFAESDLLGIPLKVIVSKKTLEKGLVELEERKSKKRRFIKIKEAIKLNFYA
jgi:prolyl-tRNA synthetase